MCDRPRGEWAETVTRKCFPRMYACGRVRATFWKRECNVQSLCHGSRARARDLPALLCALVLIGLAFGQGAGTTVHGQKIRLRGRTQSPSKAIPGADADMDIDADVDANADTGVPLTADVLLAVPRLLTVNPAPDVPIEDSNTPQVQSGGANSYVVQTSTPVRTTWESMLSLSGFPLGVCWSLKVCTYCLLNLCSKRQLTDVSCILEQNLPAPLLSKVAKLVGALVGRTG